MFCCSNSDIGTPVYVFLNDLRAPLKFDQGHQAQEIVDELQHGLQYKNGYLVNKSSRDIVDSSTVLWSGNYEFLGYEKDLSIKQHKVAFTNPINNSCMGILLMCCCLNVVYITDDDPVEDIDDVACKATCEDQPRNIEGLGI